MSNRLSSTFTHLKEKNEGALVVFVTAGDPSIEDAADLVVTLAESGADIVELGIPYSDPLADGPVIQASSQRALDRGVTPPIVLDIVHDVRKRSDVPLVLMTSYNLVLQCGLEQFASSASKAGADGAILTDLPPEEARPWKAACRTHGLDTVFLVAPTSTDARIGAIAEAASGFVYCVSRTGVTGSGSEMTGDLGEFVERVRVKTAKPLCVGFGISTPHDVRNVVKIADGAVIGSALVEFLAQRPESPIGDALRNLVGEWKAATRRETEGA